MKKLFVFAFAISMMAALAVSTSALEYTIDAPDDYDFGRSTSIGTVHTADGGAMKNTDVSKNAALIPPAFGSESMNALNTGEYLIDLVFRHEGRYYLLDYKSNWLGEDSSAYTQQAMAAAMQAHRYDLQYQLYTLALHRYLRHRIADYDYDRHFGGVIYLFLRGVDKEHPQQGIYTTRPNAGLIALMDEMFAGMTLEEA